MVEMEKNRPMSGRAEDKGMLAVVAACGPTDVIGRIRAYIDQWYGNRRPSAGPHPGSCLD